MGALQLCIITGKRKAISVLSNDNAIGILQKTLLARYVRYSALLPKKESSAGRGTFTVMVCSGRLAGAARGRGFAGIKMASSWLPWSNSWVAVLLIAVTVCAVLTTPHSGSVLCCGSRRVCPPAGRPVSCCPAAFLLAFLFAPVLPYPGLSAKALCV